MKPYEKMDSRNTALVVIDIVNGCCHEKCEDGSLQFSKIRVTVPRLVSFIKDFKTTVGGTVIYTKITPWTKEFLPQNLQELYTDPACNYYSTDTSGFSEEFYTVKPDPDDLIVTKNTYDTFANETFRNILKDRGIKYLAITGVFTDGCVLATICGGFQAGYNFVILKDMIETTDEAVRQELSQYLLKYTFPIMYGKTMTGAEFINGWG
jgi:nicotinamidase-related amidase